MSRILAGAAGLLSVFVGARVALTTADLPGGGGAVVLGLILMVTGALMLRLAIRWA